jgi:NAD(P)-dependent dehydrogenase (short-subunit alcohol dehydrogenase family)
VTRDTGSGGHGLFDLTGRVALVTGACGGIGRALSIGLGAHGASLFATDHPSQDIGQLCAELEAEGIPTAVCSEDLADPDAPARIVHRVIDEFGRIDVLVNNAGLNLKENLATVAHERWHEMSSVNLIAPFLLAREAMEAQTSRRLPLSVVNISSVAGTSALGRGNAGFGATKAGLNELTRELAVEWAAKCVRVNAIQPSQVAGPAFDRLGETDEGAAILSRMVAGIPLGRLIAAEELVGPVVFLASDAAAAVTGAVLPVDGGNLALNPGGTIG